MHKNSKWVITGAGGQLGQELTNYLKKKNLSVYSLSHLDLDITDFNSVKKAFKEIKPNFVVNCAAWTNVDAAEHNKEIAYKINVEGATNVAEASRLTKSHLFQISTDYVFKGDKVGPYVIDDITNPMTVYGKTKLRAEQSIAQILPNSHYIFRTAWLYGRYKTNFAKTIIANLSSNKILKIVDDQYGQPTWTYDLASQIYLVAQHQPKSGIFHATNAGSTNWYEFAKEIAIYLGYDSKKVYAIDSKHYRAKAIRPLNSTLDHQDWVIHGIPRMQNWKIALHQFLDLK